MINYNEVLDLFRKAVENSGLSQKQIAEILGESQQNVSNYLNKNTISLQNFLRICDVVGINPADIVNNKVKIEDYIKINPNWLPVLKQVEELGPGFQAAIMETLIQAVKAATFKR